MFAGLPGLGVGTLFFVLTGLSMPLVELYRALRGRRAPANWPLVAKQFCYALSIVASIAAAEATLLWLMGASAPGAVGPARLLNDGMKAQSPDSIFAVPVTASLVMLGSVLLVVEVLRLRGIVRPPRKSEPAIDAPASAEAA